MRLPTSSILTSIIAGPDTKRQPAFSRGPKNPETSSKEFFGPGKSKVTPGLTMKPRSYKHKGHSVPFSVYDHNGYLLLFSQSIEE